VVLEFRDLKELPGLQESNFLKWSRCSPRALNLSGPTVELSTSDGEFLSTGAELEGDISPDALAMPAWLSPLSLVSICHVGVKMARVSGRVGQVNAHGAWSCGKNIYVGKLRTEHTLCILVATLHTDDILDSQARTLFSSRDRSSMLEQVACEVFRLL
jgi:hypothetical protein